MLLCVTAGLRATSTASAGIAVAGTHASRHRWWKEGFVLGGSPGALSSGVVVPLEEGLLGVGDVDRVVRATIHVSHAVSARLTAGYA